MEVSVTLSAADRRRPRVREHLTGVLTRDDRSIQTVDDGSEALSYLRGCECDVIVAGQGRNGFDHFQLLRRVRAIRPEAKVILAGENDPVAAVRALRERAFSYLHKPLAEEPVAETVQLALDAHGWQNDLRLVSGGPSGSPSMSAPSSAPPTAPLNSCARYRRTCRRTYATMSPPRFANYC